MNRDRETLARLLGGLAPPEPPSELQGKVLRKATDALVRETARDIWTRLWESRPLRVAWGSAVAVLLAVNAVLPAGRHTSPVQAAAPNVQSVPLPGDELDAITRLPRLDTQTLPAMAQSSVAPAPHEVQRANPAAVRAKESAS